MSILSALMTKFVYQQSTTDVEKTTLRALMNAAKDTVSPKFSVHKNATNQTFSAATFTKITWPVEDFDTNNNFASDRFTPTVAGKYLLTTKLATTSVERFIISIYKNGTRFRDIYDNPNSYTQSPSGSIIVDANGTSDYFEVWIYAYNGSQTIDGTIVSTHFEGSLLI